MVCGGIEDVKLSEISMKGSTMKASRSEMGMRGRKGMREGVNIFLAGGCREEILVIRRLRLHEFQFRYPSMKMLSRTSARQA